MALQSTTALATITLQEASATVEFSGIPDTYRDLILTYTGTTTANGGVNVTINGNTSLTRVFMYGSGTTPAGGTSGGQEILYSYTTQSSATMEFIDYSATDKHKTILTRSNTAVTTFAQAQRWASTAAITSIKLDNKTFTAGSTFALFGRIA